MQLIEVNSYARRSETQIKRARSGNEKEDGSLREGIGRLMYVPSNVAGQLGQIVPAGRSRSQPGEPSPMASFGALESPRRLSC